LQASIAPIPGKEPSQTLFMLNEKREASARSFSSNADIGSQIQANTAPTTALAMIQESLIPHTAHMSMIVDSMSEEYKVLFQLNRSHLDADDYKTVVGDDEAVFTDDFNTDGLSVTCGANPEMSSKMQRMMLAQAELEQIDRVIQAGGNPIPIIKNYYKRIGSENLDEIFPNEAEMSPEEKAQMQAMQQQQELSNQLQQQQVELMALQADLLRKGEERKDFEAKVSATETNAKIDKMFEEIEKIKAETRAAVMAELATDPSRVMGGPSFQQSAPSPIFDQYASRAVAAAVDGSVKPLRELAPELRPNQIATEDRVNRAMSSFLKDFNADGSPRHAGGPAQ